MIMTSQPQQDQRAAMTLTVSERLTMVLSVLYFRESALPDS